MGKHMDEATKEEWGEKEDWKFLWRTTAQGAATTVWAAVAGVWRDQGGLANVGDGGYADHAFDEVGEGKIWRDSCIVVGVEDNV
ncbi:hypothetical protein TWF730_001029 [Orbilia blumenaviensis]|uniref:Uncharacterized protein n=1 Tax=Orbilia blumenaviensis TaxID=1796055 RepID=A0AAV9VNE4_9PEZI